MQTRKLIFILSALGLAVLLLGGASVFAGKEPPASSSAPVLAASTPTPSSPGVQGPFVGERILPASFDGDVRKLSSADSSSQRRTAPPLRRRGLAPTQGVSQPGTIRDPVAQTSNGSGRMPAPSASFNGLDFNNWGDGWPPDPNGDVGPNHYIQAVNISIGIFSKTGTQLAAFSFNNFFAAGSYPCNSSNQGDPIVLYDPISGRWIISDFAWGSSNGPFYECIAVSKTDDPVSGGWWLYTLDAGSTSTSGVYWLNDYPKWGAWADGIYMSANMYDTSNVFRASRAWVFNRDDLIYGALTGLRNVRFDVTGGYFGLLPSNLRGALPPSGTPDFFASVDEPNLLRIWKFHVDWGNQASSTFTGPTNLAAATFAMPCFAANIFACVPELNGEAVDSVGDRLMMQLQYRNIGGVESLWVNHTVAASSAVGNPTGIRWYEIRNPNASPMLCQQGTFQPDTDYRWMASMAVDKYGNMALGYSVSSASMYPAIRYAGRLSTDAPGTLGQGEATLIQGTGSQLNAHNRWGDYSAMSVSPDDDLTFWYTNEYYSTTGYNWQTRIGSFRISSTSPPVPLGPYVSYFPLIFNSAIRPCQ